MSEIIGVSQLRHLWQSKEYCDFLISCGGSPAIYQLQAPVEGKEDLKGQNVEICCVTSTTLKHPMKWEDISYLGMGIFVSPRQPTFFEVMLDQEAEDAYEDDMRNNFYEDEDEDEDFEEDLDPWDDVYAEDDFEEEE